MPDPTSTSGDADQRVAVGRINSTWGLRGHVKVTPLTSNPNRFAVGATLFVNGQPRKVVDLNTSQGYPIVKFEGFPNATAAEALRGGLIEIDEAALPQLPEGEYYLHDLEGIEVVTRDGEAVGTLVEVLTTGANDVYVIRRPGKPNALVPAIPDVILYVDLDAHRMTIEAMPGLLD
jgi:16S rRNA processing protein RimM